MSADVAVSDKRSYPRIPIHHPISLTNQTGIAVKASLLNLGPGGLQAMCDVDAAELLTMSEAASKCHPQALWMTATFDVPVGGDQLPIEVDCRLVYQLSNDNEVSIGLSFVGFRGTCRAHLRRFILYSPELA